MLGTLLVAGCGGERDGAAVSPERQTATRKTQGGPIVDLAGALDPAEQAALTERLGKGKPATVVIVKADKTQSLEQIGWAVGGSPGATRSLLILIDPESRQVRLEGDLSSGSKAAVAASMYDDLAAGRVAAAVDRGLTSLEQLGR